MTPRYRRFPALGRHLTLLRTFSVLSALIIMLIASLLAWRVQGDVEHMALQQEAVLAQGQAAALLQAGFFRHGTAASLTPDTLRQLAVYTRQNMHYDHDVRVKIWTVHGTILYSDAPAAIGRHFPIDDGLADILAGRVTSAADISDLNAPENVTERGHFRHLLEVYVPIRLGRGAPIIGAYELYHDLTLLDGQETELRRAIWGSVALGFLVLYVSLFLIVRNASHRLVRQSASLAYQARHDALTDLPNRTLLHDRLQQALHHAPPPQPGAEPVSVALLLMDLDRFKEINDTFGHHHGDQLLRQVGARLCAALRATDTVARLGGDEFAVLLPATDVQRASAVAGALVRALEEPFILEGYSVSVGASIGIAVAPEHGQDATTLLRRADVAMYAAKRATSGYAVYLAAQDQYSPERLGLVGELRRAIEQDQLLLYYQPKVDFKTGRLDSVEALVRWQHPVRGLVPPDQFIPLAEHTGLITPLSHWVLTAALRQCRAWRDAGLGIRVAVNLSARLLQDERLVDSIVDLLRAWDVTPDLLQVEVTESAVMADPARALQILTRLHEMGIRIAIDDFGTGYSSLAYLKKLPADEIKIDKSFVRDMPGNADDVTIARSVIDLDHNLGLSVVAEGVEDRAVWDQLAGMGCDLAQGYYLSRPIPAAALTSWVGALGQEKAS
jgi:diguanylate cyclase (GGDEF)-like protein